MYNPYISGFNLPVKNKGYTYLKDRNFLIHISDNKAYQKEREGSPIDKLAGGESKYIDMASKGQFIYDEDDFVVDTIATFEKTYFALLVNGKEVTVSKVRGGKLYLHQKHKAPQLVHHKIPSVDSLPIGKKTYKALQQNYNNSNIYYENIEIKKDFEREYMGVVVNAE